MHAMNGIWPGVDNLTIASYCIKVWRLHHLKPDTIGLVPPMGYLQRDVASKVARTWLVYVEACMPPQDAENFTYVGKNEGEFRVPIPHTRYKADGYLPRTRTVYEFYGCVWHGCPDCFSPKAKCLRVGQTFATLYSRTLQREGVLKDNGFNIVSMWECEWRSRLRGAGQLRDMYDFLVGEEVDALIKEPHNPREGLYGGRVDCNQLLWHAMPCSPDGLAARDSRDDIYARLSRKHLKYYDFTSLYPSVNNVITLWVIPSYCTIVSGNRKIMHSPRFSGWHTYASYLRRISTTPCYPIA